MPVGNAGIVHGVMERCEPCSMYRRRGAPPSIDFADLRPPLASPRSALD
jgi:hypothetical protein